MATLNKEYTDFNLNIKLTPERKESLKSSRNEIRRKIKKWFKDNKPDELQPKFYGQGSFEMDTTVNPIPEYDKDNNKLLKYDLDYGVYFIEIENEDHKQSINTWHDWVYKSVENHTNTPPIKKNTCVRVVFADGHHIDLPIYYKNGDTPELAHKSKDWLESDPKAFVEWFNDKCKASPQLTKIVRYLKAWKNYRETENTNLKLPSGFTLTILAVNNYVPDDNDDFAFRETVKNMQTELKKPGGFKCYRPTTPTDENLFAEFSDTRKNDFLNNLDNLVQACKNADAEKNFKKASEYLIKQFGDRFPLGKDEDEETKNSRMSSTLFSSSIKPKPYSG